MRRYRLLPDGPARTEAEWSAALVEADLAAALGFSVTVDELDFAGNALHITVFMAAPVVPE